MLGALSGILSAVVAIGDMVLWGLVSGWNLIMLAIGVALTAALALLPTMNDAPALSGTWIGWMNWFFPVGGVLSILTAAISLYLVFLGVRYVLRVARML